MSIQLYLGKNPYLGIRSGIKLHYFGKGCIVDYYGNSIGFIAEESIAILKLLEKGLRYIELCKYFGSTEDLERQLEKLFSIGVICISSNHQTENKIQFTGRAGFYYPKTLAIEVTNACNYHCPFCYRMSEPLGEYIPYDTILEIAKETKQWVPNILLTGGEPTLHPQIAEIINILHNNDVSVSMISNGSGLFNCDITALQKLDHIQISLYGTNRNEYSNITGNPTGFDYLEKSVEYALSHNISIIASLTVSDVSVPKIEEYILLAVKLGFQTIRVGIADVFGRGEYLYQSTNSFSSQRDAVLDRISIFKHKYRKIINVDMASIDVAHIGNRRELEDFVYRGSFNCGCGSEYLVISPTGLVRPCQMLPCKWFDLFSFQDIKEFINGNFFGTELQERSMQYSQYLNNAVGISEPCEAISILCRNHIKMANK